MSPYHIPEEKLELVHKELVDGIRKYVTENGFHKVLIGLSGGIDSSLTCALATEALGAENVMGISMPSKYSSTESEKLAKELAKNLGIEFAVVSIEKLYDTYIDVLSKDLVIDEDADVDVYLQNIQARIRGNILMAFSNRRGFLVLATGNKSEAMMGYCTLYGDTVGGLAVISDLLKAGVYQLSHYINRGGEIIPKAIIDRVPSAELRPGQVDQDSLPVYDILDEILHYHLEEGITRGELEEKGFDPVIVSHVLATIVKMGYKRNQCPPGIKISKSLLK